MAKVIGPQEAIHAALDERGFYTPSCADAAQVAADAVPDGWAKVKGSWIRLTPTASGWKEG